MQQLVHDPKKAQYMVDGAEKDSLSALMQKLSMRIRAEIQQRLISKEGASSSAPVAFFPTDA